LLVTKLRHISSGPHCNARTWRASAFPGLTATRLAVLIVLDGFVTDLRKCSGMHTTPKPSRYELIKENKNWYKAADDCRRRGQRLVQIRTRADQIALEQYLQRFGQYQAQFTCITTP